MTRNSTSGFRTLLGRATTLTVTLLICGAATAAVVGGRVLLSEPHDTMPAQTAPRVPVGVMPVELVSGYTVTRRFTGIIEAAARTDLAFEFGGRITEILVDEGDLVREGDVLGKLDTSALIPERAALEAELDALSADAELARLTLMRNDALTERGFRSVAAQDDARLAMVRAQAGMAATRARLAGVDVRLQKSVLVAPFAARIGARMADPGQTAAAGQPVLVLHATKALRARIGLPPDLAAQLSVSQPVAIDLNGQSLEARIGHIRPDLDPRTRTRAVIVVLPQGAEPVLGDTVALLLTQHVEDRGFWVPLGALREGVRGSWSVMAIEVTPDGPRTRPAAIEVLHSDGTRVFVRGDLPPAAQIVTIAPDRVAPGQLVLAQIGPVTAK